jgi:glutathione S-transferase
MSDTLTFFKVSQPGRAVRWFVKNNSIPVELNTIEFGDAAKPEYAEKTPYQAVPILELHSGGVLTESCAIINYLATKYEKRTEYPEDALLLARVHEAQFHNNDSLARLFSAKVFRHLMPIFFGAPLTPAAVQAVIEKEFDGISWHFKLLDGILQRQKWIAGASFTVADYNVICELNQWPLMESAGFIPEVLKLAHFPGVSRYLQDAKQIPSHDEFAAETGFAIGLLKAKAEANAAAPPPAA